MAEYKGALDRRPRDGKGSVAPTRAGWECPECRDHLRMTRKPTNGKHYLICRNCGFSKPVLRGKVGHAD